jgi:hypothetical protein
MNTNDWLIPNNTVEICRNIYIPAMRREMKSEITVWDPPKRFEYKTLDTPLSVKSGISIEPEANGVRIAFIGDGELGDFFKLAEGLL